MGAHEDQQTHHTYSSTHPSHHLTHHHQKSGKVRYYNDPGPRSWHRKRSETPQHSTDASATQRPDTKQRNARTTDSTRDGARTRRVRKKKRNRMRRNRAFEAAGRVMTLTTQSFAPTTRGGVRTTKHSNSNSNDKACVYRCWPVLWERSAR